MDLGCHDAARGGEDLVHFRRRLDRGGPAEIPPRAVGSQHTSRRERSDLARFEPDRRFGCHPRFLSDDVEQAVVTALTEPEKGHLALQNIPIGLPLFRSAILAQIHAVPGVTAVRALRFNGTEAPFGIAAGEGEYHNLLSGLVAGNTAAGDVLVAAT